MLFCKLSIGCLSQVQVSLPVNCDWLVPNMQRTNEKLATTKPDQHPIQVYRINLII